MGEIKLKFGLSLAINTYYNVQCCSLAKLTSLTGREVDEMEARLWAELHGFSFFETSANTGAGITDMFQV